MGKMNAGRDLERRPVIAATVDQAACGFTSRLILSPFSRSARISS
jgi:hypothetical protein